MSAGRQYRIHIGLEIHEDTDQLIRIEQGTALVKMGDCKERLDFQKEACTGDIILVPAGTVRHTKEEAEHAHA